MASRRSLLPALQSKAQPAPPTNSVNKARHVRELALLLMAAVASAILICTMILLHLALPGHQARPHHHAASVTVQDTQASSSGSSGEQQTGNVDIDSGREGAQERLAMAREGRLAQAEFEQQRLARQASAQHNGSDGGQAGSRGTTGGEARAQDELGGFVRRRQTGDELQATGAQPASGHQKVAVVTQVSAPGLPPWDPAWLQAPRQELPDPLKAALKAGRVSGAVAAHCNRHFGVEWLQLWDQTAQPVCQRQPSDLRPSSADTTIRCRTMNDDHIPNATWPHVLCDATDLMLDPSLLTPAACPRHRRGYLCHSPTYHRYSPGAWSGSCTWPGFRLSDFPKDHLQDIFESYAPWPADSLPKAAVERVRTLVVTREVKEHANVFHATTDLLNVYITLHILGWQHQPRQVLLLDEHVPGRLDGLWSAVAAGGGAPALPHALAARAPDGRQYVKRVLELGRPTLFQRAAFVPPGYGSLLFSHLYEGSSCPHRTALFSGFRDFVLRPFGLHLLQPTASQPLQVTFISRRSSRKVRKVTRRIANEAEVADALAALPGVKVSIVDLAQLDLQQQLSIIAHTDVLVGMHGAALTYSLLLAPHAGLLELWPAATDVWRCYEHTSRWAGLAYRRWANTDPAKVHKSLLWGDETTVDVAELQPLAHALMEEVRRRRDKDAAPAAEQ